MLNVAMWGKALRVIPRIDKATWEGLDLVSRWLIATRSAVLIITFISTAVAGLLAFRDHPRAFDLGVWALLAVGLVLAHATNNLVNDLTDHAKGVDRGNYFRAQYGPQPLEHGLLSTRQMVTYAAVTGGLAIAAGLALVALRGGHTLTLMGAGAFFVLFYTWPLKYVGLGELAVLAVWGPLMIAGGYYVLTGVWSWQVVLASIPYGLGATVVLFGKHIDKLDADRSKGIRTLPVLLGDGLARRTAIGLMAAQYVLAAWLVITGYFSPLVLVVVFALGTFVRVSRIFARPKPDEAPSDYPADTWPLWFVAHGFAHNRRFGLLYVLGLVGDVVLQATGVVRWEGLL